MKEAIKRFVRRRARGFKELLCVLIYFLLLFPPFAVFVVVAIIELKVTLPIDKYVPYWGIFMLVWLGGLCVFRKKAEAFSEKLFIAVYRVIFGKPPEDKEHESKKFDP